MKDLRKWQDELLWKSFATHQIERGACQAVCVLRDLFWEQIGRIVQYNSSSLLLTFSACSTAGDFASTTSSSSDEGGGVGGGGGQSSSVCGTLGDKVKLLALTGNLFARLFL